MHVQLQLQELYQHAQRTVPSHLDARHSLNHFRDRPHLNAALGVKVATRLAVPIPTANPLFACGIGTPMPPSVRPQNNDSIGFSPTIKADTE